MILLRIAIRNIFSNKIKSLVIGSIIIFGTIILVLGMSFFYKLKSSMRESVVYSVSGHLQVYSTEGEDQLNLFQQFMAGELDVGEIPNFSVVKEKLLEIDNVESVIPMGINNSIVSLPNIMDIKIENLRQGILAGDDISKVIEIGKNIVNALSTLKKDMAAVRLIGSGTGDDNPFDDINIALSSELWEIVLSPYGIEPFEEISDEVLTDDDDLPADENLSLEMPAIVRDAAIQVLGENKQDELSAYEVNDILLKEDIIKENGVINQNKGIEFLANRVAPLLADEAFHALFYIGTDLSAYTSGTGFSKFECVEEEGKEGCEAFRNQPPGTRGFLFNNVVYEKQLKNEIAVRLDNIKEELDSGKTIKESDTIQQQIERNKIEKREIIFELDTENIKEVVDELINFLEYDESEFSTNEQDNAKLETLLDIFFTMDDGNFYERYNFFYTLFKNRIRMYKYNIGDYIFLKSFLRGGGTRNVKVRIQGVFTFKGLEGSDVASIYSLVDMVTFRQLYGLITPEQIEERDELARESGIERLGQDDIMAMFETASSIESEGENVEIDESERISSEAINIQREELERAYSQEEIEQGMCVSAALFLKDPSLERETIEEIARVSKEYGLNIQAIDWQTASGDIGNLVYLIEAIIVIAVIIIFGIALVIIVNSMIMATMERIREIGTMRAIGANRRYILNLFLVETIILCLIFGIIGFIFAVIVIGLLSVNGIPATNDIMHFIFGGDSLVPELNLSTIILTVITILMVSIISTIYPAYLASKIQPVIAMGKED